MTEQERKHGPALRRTPDQPCLNCGDPTAGEYCPRCGQAKRTVAVSVWALLMEVLEDQFILSRALPRTMGALIARPGRLTAEYVQGRIVSYIAPFRLYLVSSVLFFLALSFWTSRMLATVTVVEDRGAEASAERAAAAREAMAQLDTLDLTPEARAAVESARAALAAGGAEGVAAGEAGGAAAVEPGGVQPWVRNLTINTGDAARDSMFRARIVERYGRLPALEALRRFLPDYIGYVPHLMFVLLPIFALLLKLLYIRRRRYYSEHFVFALHVHAFVFLMFLLMLLARHWIVTSVLSIWIFVYIWVAMKRVYAQGWFRTTVKYGILGLIYFMLLNLGLALTVFPALLL